MNKSEAACICTLILSVTMLILGLLFIYKVSSNISELTEALNQPGISSNLTIEYLKIQPPDSDTYIEIKGLETSINSRILDILANTLSGNY